MLPDFGELLYALIKKRGSIRDFAKKAGVSDSNFAMIRKGAMPPPLKRVEQWADMLDLSGSERETFLDAAAVAHAPERVAKLVHRLERRVAEREHAYEALEKKVDRIMGGDSTKR